MKHHLNESFDISFYSNVVCHPFHSSERTLKRNNGIQCKGKKHFKFKLNITLAKELVLNDEAALCGSKRNVKHAIFGITKLNYLSKKKRIVAVSGTSFSFKFENLFFFFSLFRLLNILRKTADIVVFFVTWCILRHGSALKFN